ncbi:hypothetical protein [Swingsia samuiensis]|uniref:Uncharacterized protein n=1 Tax=Swingsia samuiensis TaxID=1293412 RepID=A0A4Y6UNA9_9PROT|nr:hypothetical protein [Swingsia samuiensis]QDH17847.1 hypothetical protein E3D00_09900 [Swingsia samuiensis]
MARHWAGKLVLGVMSISLCVGAGKAHARSAITDYEASKLTFDALTATPVYHHHRTAPHFYRHTYATSKHALAFAATAHHSAYVRNVSYRPKYIASASAHHHTRHRRT